MKYVLKTPVRRLGCVVVCILLVALPVFITRFTWNAPVCGAASLVPTNNPTEYYGRGVTCIQAGNLQQAIANYDHAITLQPEFAEAYYGRGIAEMNVGALENALADFNRAIKLKPNQADAL